MHYAVAHDEHHDVSRDTKVLAICHRSRLNDNFTNRTAANYLSILTKWYQELGTTVLQQIERTVVNQLAAGSRIETDNQPE